MKVSLILPIIVLLIFMILRLFHYEDYKEYFNAAQFIVVGLSLLSMGRYLIKNRGTKKAKQLLLDLIEQRFGKTFAAYLIYEIKLLVGLFHFIRAPIRNYKAVMNSYFATEKLKAVFIAIPFLILLETGMIHVLISTQLEGVKASILHSLIIISELWLCEILIGNLYYLQHSVVHMEHNFQFKMGIMWELDVPLQDIDRVENSQRPQKDSTPKLSLLHDELVRIYFRREVTAIKHFRTIRLTQADIFLRPEDHKRLETQLAHQN